MFKKVDPNQSFPEMEENILKFWDDKDIFKKTIDSRKDGEPFIFYEGPPTANGKPGIHHVLARVFKDIIPRFKVMQGFYVERKAGWDTHGLPVELEVEKQVGISGKPDIEKYGIEKFNKKCRESVWTYTSAWEEMTKRIGYWVDMENAYVTYKNEYIESVWWILSEIWKKGLLYQDYKIVPYCCRCGTPLSSHEVAQGYKDVKEITITAKFKLKSQKDTYLLAWTTTPWTLLGNVALAVGADIDYVKIEKDNQFLIMAESRLEAYSNELGDEYKIVKKIKGNDLVNLEYEPLFDWYESDKKGYYVVAEDFVTTADGTGIVHMALYGEDDYNVIKKHDLPRIKHVDEEGKLIKESKKWSRRYFKDEGFDVDIIKDLAERDLFFAKAKNEHSYPFCWRCDTPLIYFAISSWFIKISQLRDKLTQNNSKINWHPSHIKDGRFGKWLEEAKDWALSRNRYWGTPLPIWSCECGHQHCISSIEELKKLSVNKLNEENIDLHRPYIDEVKIKCDKCDSEMQRSTEVIDCWFDSGAMPLAQHNYPFSNKDTIEKKLPADYICEAIDQTRGWFYTLLAISTLIFDTSSYKNVICLGHILDGEGKKMSKSKGNVVNPWDILNKYGADSCRWYMYNANPPGNSRCFSGELVEKSLRKFLLTLWNTYQFFITYAQIDEFNPDENKVGKSNNDLDQWILSELQVLIEEVSSKLENYQIWESTQSLEQFLDHLSNWYVRRSRKRFWKSENDDDKDHAYQTLYHVILTTTKLLAPFMPFVSEEIYQNLAQNKEESVHLETWPKIKTDLINISLNEEMKTLLKVVTLGHGLRAKSNIKVRQPLSKIQLVAKHKFKKEHIDVIKEELNIKEIETCKEVSSIAKQKVVPNPKILGPKYGPKVQEIIKLCKEENYDLLNENEVKVDQYTLKNDEFEIVFEGKEGFDIAAKDGIVVALDTTIDENLQKEGNAREIVRYIQEMRKEADYQVSDRIIISLEGDKELLNSINEFKTYIEKETLAKLQDTKIDNSDISKELKIESALLIISIKK